MPSETMPAEDRRGHHHPQGEARQDQMAVAPTDPEFEDEKMKKEMVNIKINFRGREEGQIEKSGGKKKRG